MFICEKCDKIYKIKKYYINHLLTCNKKIIEKKDNIQLFDIELINKRINDEYCIKTNEMLSDYNLMSKYVKCKSVINNINILSNIFNKYIEDETIKQSIINEYLIQLIPPGTKGIIKGLKFNKIIKNKINAMNLKSDKFIIKFEKKCEKYITQEIPDWFILEIKTNKIIIGMNQLDIINGGHQINRGSKYLIDNNHNTDTSKLLCVINNYVQFKKINKKSNLFNIGFKNNTLTYINNLENIIYDFFNIKL